MAKQAGRFEMFERLQGTGCLTASNVTVLKNYQAKWNCSAFHAILKTHIFSEQQLATSLAKAFQLERVFNIDLMHIPKKALSEISYKDAKRFQCIPLNFRADINEFKVAVADPTPNDFWHKIRARITGDLTFSIGELSDILKAIDRNYTPEEQFPSIMEDF